MPFLLSLLSKAEGFCDKGKDFIWNKDGYLA